MNIKDIKRDSIDFTNEVQKHFERLSSTTSVSKATLEEAIEVPPRYLINFEKKVVIFLVKIYFLVSNLKSRRGIRCCQFEQASL